MRVYELINKLLKAPAGANIYIQISDKISDCNKGEEILLDLVLMDGNGNITVTKK